MTPRRRHPPDTGWWLVAPALLYRNVYNVASRFIVMAGGTRTTRHRLVQFGVTSLGVAVSHVPALVKSQHAIVPVPCCLCARLDVVHATSRLKGIHVCAGLQSLDRHAVTTNERVQAFQRLCVGGSARGREVATALYRCRLAVVAKFGQTAVNQLLCGSVNGPVRRVSDVAALARDATEDRAAAGRSAGAKPPVPQGLISCGVSAYDLFAHPVGSSGALTHLRVLRLRHLGLTVVDLRGMTSLEVVDVRHNNLVVSDTAVATATEATEATDAADVTAVAAVIDIAIVAICWPSSCLLPGLNGGSLLQVNCVTVVCKRAATVLCDGRVLVCSASGDCSNCKCCSWTTTPIWR